jgi:ribosome maturation factor RimP
MIDESHIVTRLEQALIPILQDFGLDLVEIEFRPSGQRWLLRVFIDKDGGVTIGDCERVSREFGTILDVEEIIDHPYKLEVSSPGLTRTLKEWQDFARYRGRSCRILTKDPVGGQTEFRGEIVEATENEVLLAGKIDVFKIPMCAIKKANLEFEL